MVPVLQSARWMLSALQRNTVGSVGPDADIVRSDTYLAGGLGFCEGVRVGAGRRRDASGFPPTPFYLIYEPT